MVGSAVLIAVADHPPGRPSRPELDGLPSALIPVLDQPIVIHAVRDLVGLGVGRIVVVVDSVTEGPVSRALDDGAVDGATVGLLCRDPDHGLPEAIGSARLMLGDGPFLLRFADCLGRMELGAELDSVGELDAVALMSRFDVAGEVPDRLPGRKREARSAFQVGVFVLGSGFPSTLPGAGDDSSSLMESALDWMEGRGGRVDRRYVTGWWRQCDGRPGILAANRFALAELEAGRLEAETIDSDVEGAVVADPTVTIEASVIRGPAWVGPGARVANAFVGPFTVIGSGVSIDGAEIENSVVLEGSRISNVSGRLDSSVIGPRATVEKDFRLPRGTRLEVGPGANVMLG